MLPRLRDAILLLLVAGAAGAPASRALRAQDSAASHRPTIGPGMTRDEVIAHLGSPLAERQEGAHTYFFYDAGCQQEPCGSNDVVIFDNGSVTDALFRSGLRTYTGTSAPATVLPSLTGSKTKPHSTTHTTTPIRAAATGDTTHRGGIIFVGPRPIGTPAAPYQTIPAPHTDTTRSQPPLPSPATPPSAPPQ
jgi:hypothetical protein